jgi:ABC-type multidrug transport system fused ATPase/permease subunit
VRAQYKAEVDKAQAEAAQAKPLADAQAQREVLAMRTELAQRAAELRQQELVAEVVKPAEAEAERVRILAVADAEKMKIQAEAAASHNRVALDRMLIDQLPEIVKQAAQGYDSLIGDRGLTMSGGQRQRIGIARALIRDNPILILDEPTAALDAESEELVIQALERLMKGRTVITIAHRLSTLRHADKIIVIKDGVVAEDGTHEQLLKRDGVYARLRHLQYDMPA